MKVAESTLLTIPKSIERSGRSRATIYRRIKVGDLSPVVEGGRVKVPAQQLDQVFADRAYVTESVEDANTYADDQSAAKRLAARAPKLSEAQRQHLAALITPLVTTESGGAK